MKSWQSALSRFASLCLWVGGVASVGFASPAGLARPSKYASFQPLDPALRPSLVEVPDIPGLPRVLLIGDSISIGYTLPVRARLAGRANVHRPEENGGSTGYGLERVETWLGTSPWAVIHFNFGLHDLKYLDAAGNYVDPEQGTQLVPLAEYEKNLRTLVHRLQRTGATLVFATTTPVPTGTAGRPAGSEVPYNEVAVRVMREAGIAVDDLHAYALAQPPGFQLPQNVHFSPAAYDALAARVSASIAAALAP